MEKGEKKSNDDGKIYKIQDISKKKNHTHKRKCAAQDKKSAVDVVYESQIIPKKKEMNKKYKVNEVRRSKCKSTKKK